MNESTIESIENTFCTIQFGFDGPTSIVKTVFADVKNLEGVHKQLAHSVVKEVDQALSAALHKFGNTTYNKVV